MPLLRHLLDWDQAGNDPDNGRIFKLVLDVTLNYPDASAAVEQDGHSNSKGSKRATGSGKGKDKPVSAAASLRTAVTVFPSVEAEQLMHRALRATGQVQTLALRSLLSLASTTKNSRGNAGAAAVMGEESVRQRRDLVLTLVEVGLAGADASLVAAAARALPVRPCGLAALLGGLVPVPTGISTPSKVIF